MNDFDPNNPGRDVTRRGKNWNYDWATYVPNRTPKFKVHACRGHATSAVKDKAIYSMRGGYDIPEEVKLYTKKEGLWVEVQLATRFLPYHSNIDIITGEAK